MEIERDGEIELQGLAQIEGGGISDLYGSIRHCFAQCLLSTLASLAKSTTRPTALGAASESFFLSKDTVPYYPVSSICQVCRARNRRRNN